MQDCDNLSKWIETIIVNYVDKSEENCLGKAFNEKAWDSPLVGFSNGDDPWYIKLKEDIGEFLWTPMEIFKMTFPEIIDLKASDLTVICWALPQTEKTKNDMRNENIYPAERATLSRTNGDNFNKKVAKYLIQALSEKGYRAIAPVQSPFWEDKKSQKYGYASTWSERHAAFVSGLGTFSLTDTLITKLGTAVRLGSIIAQVPIKPTERKYVNYNEYCLYSSKGGCKKCISRCPANAISENGHDKIKCREYQREVTGKYISQNYDINSRYCGLCQFDVPCESCIP